MRLPYAAKLLLLFVAIAALAKPAEARRGAPPRTVKNFVPKELIVKYQAPVARRGSHRSLLGARGAKLLKSLDDQGLVRVQVADGQSVEEAVRSLTGSEGVEFAQPNYAYRKMAAPNDSQYAQQWHLRNTGQTISGADYTSHNPGTAGLDIGAETAWNTITDCSSVTVAVVDSGVNYTHEDLAGNMWDGGASYPNHGYDFLDNDNNPMDLDGHGTHVAGIIGARGNSALGTSGVCWRAKIMAVRVLDASGSGTSAGVVSGINFAVANGAKVINLSLGQPVNDPSVAAAITNAQNNGVVVVAAAGNDGTNNESAPVYPCNLPNANLLCVAALDQSFALTNFSNYGVMSVDVAAPGANIQSLVTGSISSQTDSFTGWTGLSGSWGTGSGSLGGVPKQLMLNPANWNGSTNKYANSLDARVYKSFNLSGADAATLDVSATYAFAAGDLLSVGFLAASGDPFGAGGTLAGSLTGNSGAYVEPNTFDLSDCQVSPCTVGFRMSTNSSGVDTGVALLDFSLNSLTLNTHSYEAMSGTSMAAPVVAGIAAMVKAYNPSYTADDVITAVKAGGTSIPALGTKTSTGRAASASGSLHYIAPPTGCAAAVQ